MVTSHIDKRTQLDDIYVDIPLASAGVKTITVLSTVVTKSS